MLDKNSRIFIPLNDVNLFSPEFFYHTAHADTILSYTGSNWIYIRIVAVHCDLGAGTCLTGYIFDLNHTALDLCHFGLEQSFYQFRMSTGNKDLRSPGRVFYFCNIYFDSLMWFKFFTFHLLLRSKNGINLAQIDIVIAIAVTLNHTGYNIFLFCLVKIKQDFSFFFPDLLNNNLFCFLSCNTTKVLWCCFLSDHISYDLARISYSCLCNRNLSCLIFYFLYYFFIQINMKFSCFTV